MKSSVKTNQFCERVSSVLLRAVFSFRISDFGFRVSNLSRTALLLAVLALTPAVALAQPRPYIGFVYPAGGQQGTTVQIRLGGQGLDDVQAVLVNGAGITARIAENYRRLNNQEMQLLNEQLRELRRDTLSAPAKAEVMMSDEPAMMTAAVTNSTGSTNQQNATTAKKETARKLIEKIEKRTREFVQTPASAAIASLVMVEVTIAPDAEPGERQIRLTTLRGVSNPLAFYVGQVPEHARQPMQTATLQVLGKEAQALRKRLPGEGEQRISIPCTANGQIASGEVNRYRFEARRGQRLVMTTLARQLVPFMADAVPGWFQPVLVLYDAKGKEIAYDDDYKFKPDPTILYEVPSDGEYVLEIHDSLYRGREDFVYRITIGELPFITSIFPLGGHAGVAGKPQMKGWNLQGVELVGLSADAPPGLYSLAAKGKALVSNPVPFVLDTLPETTEQEPNNSPAKAQKLKLPVIINGRIDKPDDWDVFRFTGKSNDVVVVEVQARRLDSPLDSVLKLTDASGRLLALNDDHEDMSAGLNTHAADSWLMATLPADGTYYVHLGDTARHGGEDYGYRLRISAPQPDFELRVVPSSLALRSKTSGTLTVYAKRKDGFSGPIKLTLKNPPAGFDAMPINLAATQTVARVNIKTSLASTPEPVALTISGSAKIGDQEIAHEAVAAEDRMQAFLWRHLVPAQDLKVLVYDPSYQPKPQRALPEVPPPVAATNAAPATNANLAAATVARTNLVGSTNVVSGTNAPAGTNIVAAVQPPRFTKQQVAARLRQLKLLYEEGMLEDDFYVEKVVECQTSE